MFLSHGIPRAECRIISKPAVKTGRVFFLHSLFCRRVIHLHPDRKTKVNLSFHKNNIHVKIALLLLAGVSSIYEEGKVNGSHYVSLGNLLT